MTTHSIWKPCARGAHHPFKSLLPAALVLLLAACGGGGGSAPPPPGPVTATFTPIAAPPGASVVISGPGTPQSGSITLDINAQSLPAGTYAVAFDLDFETQFVAFSSFQSGSFFEAAGPVSYQVTTAPGNAGKLIVGVSLAGATGGASGSGRVVSLRFNVQSNTGTSSLTFAGNTAFAASGAAIPGVTWAAGSIRNQR